MTVLGEAGSIQLKSLSTQLNDAFGSDVETTIIDTHRSKSNILPIVRAEKDGWNTSVAWFAHNYYGPYTAFRFKQSISAMLLRPLTSLLGRKHMSGHEQHCPLPDITNLERDYWLRRQYEGFACFASGWRLSTALRYLESVAKIDLLALYDCVLDKTSYGKCDTIDGNAVNFKEMSRILGVPPLDTYDKDVAVPPNKVIEKIFVDWFGVYTDIRPCAVEVQTMPGMLLPGPTAGAACYVDPRDTRLDGYLKDDVQLRWSEETKYKDERMLSFVPLHIFKYWRPPQEQFVTEREQLKATPYGVYPGYGPASFQTRRFRFEMHNALDAVLFIKWWLDAAIPCAEEAIARGTPGSAEADA